MNHTHHSGGTGAAMAKARENSALRCTIPGCTGHRSGLSVLCGPHTNIRKRLGHPLAKRIDRAEWAGARAEVLAIFQANLDHPGLVNGLQLIERLFALHDQGTSKPTVDTEVRRLLKAGVTPAQVLTEVAAVSVYIARGPRLPDLKAENVLISNAVLGLAPLLRRTAKGSTDTYPVRPATAALTYVGRALRDSLSLLLATTVIAVQAKAEADRKAQRDRYEAATKPFSITSTEVPY